ncbi:MAG: hypothetical protein HYW52_01980 [Gemmatimonadetes bacterium]|nr:hypothetical protein [Gemmatimonadota bacterium]
MWWPALVAQLVATAHPDSIGVLRAARSAQASFEQYRIAHLPRARSGGRPNRCDEVVGRFCFWHDEDETWQATPEPPATVDARRRLLHTLDSWGALLPGDPWIVGQRVRYLIELGAGEDARAAARGCRSSPWWCAALLGYALHAGRDYPRADSAFASALAAMPEEQRCRWTDLSLVLDGLRGRYRKLSCAQRAALERRIWWLADPLHLVPGNERRTEHFARRVINALQEEARSAYGVRWGADLEELLLRYGWPVGWEREEPIGAAAPLRPAIISHNQRESRHFLPPARFVEAPNTILPDEWELDPDGPVTGYAPPYAAVFHALPHQVAVFRRGDSIVVVAGYDVRAGKDQRRRARASAGPGEPARNVARVEAALVLAPDEIAEPVILRGMGHGPEGVMTAIAPAASALLSLETLDTADSVHAARARYWLPVLPPAQDVALSHPLILRAAPEDAPHPSLADVIPLVRPVARARRGERVGVFWETYGLERSTRPFRVTLTVTQVGRSWIRKVTEWAGLAKRDPHYVSLSWEEAPRPGTSVYPRALAISLPEASPGVYHLEVTVAVPGMPIASAEREITIEP